MAWCHRKLLSSAGVVCNAGDLSPQPEDPPTSYAHPYLPPPPLNNNISLIVILLFCALATALLVLSYLTYIKRYYANPNNNRRRNPRMFDDDQEDFVDENHGPVLDHPIWYINTVGLPQSVIDSISVFKYKRGEGLIEGTDCSVCLSEFEEDETLRLLPKCSHAFHIPCIDTWLRSHTNCPLCRAPIVCENARVSAPEPNTNHLAMREETRVENSENYNGLGGDQAGGGGTSEVGVENGNGNFDGLPSEEGIIGDIQRKDSRGFKAKSCEFRVVGDNHTGVEEELQPVRRSVSMDASSASRIYLAVANIPQVQLEGSSSTRLVEVKKPNSEKVAKGVRRNLSISRLMKTSSMRFSWQNGPVCMKRSYSSSGKFSSPRRYSRSQDSVFPL